MDSNDFEKQLKALKDTVNNEFESEDSNNLDQLIEYTTRSLKLLVKSELELETLFDIYCAAGDCLKGSTLHFLYTAYLKIWSEFGNNIDRYDIILIIAFILRDKADYSKPVVSDERLGLIYQEAFELIKKFDIIESNMKEDEMVGATGEFGYNASNPIPVCGFEGLNLYLSKLRTADGEISNIQRIGSFSSKNIKGVIDGYKIITTKGDNKGLFFCIYNSRTSERAPDDFVFEG